MYYPPPANSPKHDQSLWSRSSAYNPYVNGGPPPPPPPPPPQPAIHHQHHSSIHQVFPLTPPTQSTQQVNMLQNGSPQQQPPPLSHHWQSQLLKAELCRQASTPHHRARASAMATRNSAKAPIPITNPNAKLQPPPVSQLSSDTSSNATGSPQSDKQTSPSSSSAVSTSVAVSSSAAPTTTTITTTTTTTPTTPAVERPMNGHTPSASTSSQRYRTPNVRKQQESTWTTLDLGGIRLKNLSLNLFRFSYLTVLYLNHNSLTFVPPEISRLRQLILLDLSGNELTSVPPELGMLTLLRELYLFDNHITTFPHELGGLHQLEMLGVEGNPLETPMRNILQKDGTSALIAYLRDSCPVPSPPPERQWRLLQSETERRLHENDPMSETFTLLSYNILCERSATSHIYGYTPSWALAWDYRKELILTEIMNYDADFLCLQEVEVGQYEDYFLQNLSPHDYEGVHWPKSRARTMGEAERRRVDGCATFYKATKYQLIESLLIEFNQIALQRPDFKKTDDMFNRVFTKDHIAVVTLLENRATGSRLIIANVHIYWDAEYRDVKLVQAALLMDELQKISDRFAKLPPRLFTQEDPNRPPPPVYADGSKIPTVVCGDFNSLPDSGVYDFLANGTVPSDHPDFMSHVYGKYTSDGLKHRLSLKSIYANIGELSMTNHTPTFQGVIDYIWFSTTTLAVTSVLGEVDKTYLSKVVGFPNAHFPSDHICLVGEFRVKPPKDNPVRPPPIFPSSSSSSIATITNGTRIH